MGISASMIATVRRMVAESTSTTYSDSVLEDVIAKYPLIDTFGYFTDDDDWTATYDLNAAAAQIWAEKAAGLADRFDFSADGGNFSRSQEFEQATRMAAFFKARRSLRSTRLILSPKEGEVADEDPDDSNK